MSVGNNNKDYKKTQYYPIRFCDANIFDQSR